MSAGDDGHGGSRERTGLAWRRTALAFVLNGVLLVRTGDSWTQIAAGVVAALGTGIAATAAFTFRSDRTYGWLAASGHRSVLLTILATGVAILDLIAIVR